MPTQAIRQVAASACRGTSAAIGALALLLAAGCERTATDGAREAAHAPITAAAGPAAHVPSQQARAFEAAVKQAAAAPPPPANPEIARAKTLEEAFAAMKRAEDAQAGKAGASPFGSRSRPL